MYSFILKVLKIRPKEIFTLGVTCLQAIFIGVYLASFDIGSHAIFLDTFQTDQIPLAFVISGIFGVLLMSVYTFFSSRVPFRTFATFNYLAISIITILLFYYAEFGDLINLDLFGYPLMLPFTLMFPVNIIVLLTFWYSMNNIYIADQSKRLLPYIQLSHIGGIVLGSWGIILFLFKSWNLELIILGSAVSILVAFILQLVINPVHKYSKIFLHRAKKINPIRSKFFELFYTKYTFYLILFVFISALAGMIIHFDFIDMTRESYPSIIGFAKFMGLFVGTVFIFIYGVDRFLIRKILYSYDSPYSIILIPAGMAILTVVTLVTYLFVGGITAIFRFSYIFLLVAIIKAGYETFKNTIELPSLRVLFQTLDIRFQRSIVPRTEGTFRLFSMIFAGFIIIGLIQLIIFLRQQLPDSELLAERPRQIFYIFILISLIILSLVWLIVSIKLIKSYQSALRSNIKKIRMIVKAKEHDLSSVDKHFHEMLNSDIPGKVISVLAISENTEPLSFENHLIDLLNVPSPEIRTYILWKINRLSVFNALNGLKEIKINGDDTSSLNLKNNTIEIFEKKQRLAKTVSSVETLANSKKINDRILACEIIACSGGIEDSGTLLINLARDFEPDVKSAAIKAMTRLSNPEHTHILIGYLSSPVYYPYAFEALIKIGNEAINQLEQVFLLPDADNTLLSRIVKIYGKIGGPIAHDMLINKLENQNRIIARQAIISLRESGFQATPNNINRILNAIVRILNIMSWNLSALQGIGVSNKLPLLENTLNAELADNYRVLFHLLSLAYNSTAIANIRNLIIDGNDRDIGYGIEMLDQIVNEEIKQVLFPVLENLSMRERVKQLKYFFPAENIITNELISEVISRDYNAISMYAKACAIFSWDKLKYPVVDQVLVSNLFHPSKLIRESAAYIINKIDKNYLNDVYPRIDPSIVNEIKTSIEHSKSNPLYLIFNCIQFMRQCPKLKNIPEYVLLDFAAYLELHKFDNEKEIVIDPDDKVYSLLIVVDGYVEISAEGYDNITFKKYSLIYTSALANTTSCQLIAKADKDTQFYSMDRDSLNMMIFDYADIKSSVLDCIAEI
jgi:AAA family ATP:ADP antiporter